MIKKEEKEESIIKEGITIINNLENQLEKKDLKLKGLKEELKDTKKELKDIKKDVVEKNDYLYNPHNTTVNDLIEEAREISVDPVEKLKEIKDKIKNIKGDDFKGSLEEEKINKIITKEKNEELMIKKD